MTASASDDPALGFATHEVMKQAGALENYNAFSNDKPLAEAIKVFGADWSADHLAHAGALVGSRAFGTLPHGLDTQSIVDRARIEAS